MSTNKKFKVAIIDYEFGNSASVKNALDYLKIKNDIKYKPQLLDSYTHLILPGDGFFPSTIKILKKHHWDKAIFDFYKNDKKKVIGICVGMQVMTNYSYEGNGSKGFGLINGKCLKLNKGKSKLKLPHIGFNEMKIDKIKYSNFFYFIHSYGIKVDGVNMNKIFKDNNEVGFTSYGFNFLSYFNSKRLAGFQFHPEKSSEQGLKLLKKTIEYI